MPYDQQTTDIFNQLNTKADSVLAMSFQDGLQECLCTTPKGVTLQPPAPAVSIPPAAPPAPTSVQEALRREPVSQRLRFVNESLDRPLEQITDVELLLNEMEELSLHKDVPLHQRIDLASSMKGLAEMIVREYEVEKIPSLEALCKSILGKA